MSKSKRRNSPGTFKVDGSIVQEHPHFRWKHVARAKVYQVQWMDKTRRWRSIDFLEGDEIVPDEDGFLEYIDAYPGPMGPDGTYRIVASFSESLDGKQIASLPVVLASFAPAKTAKDDLRKRLDRRKSSARVKALFLRLKWTPHGWTMLLPKEAGKCLGKRIELEVTCPQLTDAVIDLLETIFVNLPTISARAERAFDDYGGFAALDEEDQTGRPRIWIDEEMRQRKSASAWTMVVEVKGSDYAWHIEFVGARFKEIWAGD